MLRAFSLAWGCPPDLYSRLVQQLTKRASLSASYGVSVGAGFAANARRGIEQNQREVKVVNQA